VLTGVVWKYIAVSSPEDYKKMFKPNFPSWPTIRLSEVEFACGSKLSEGLRP